MVQIERILEGELPVAIRVHDASVLDDIYVVRRPPGGDITDDTLQQLWPVAGKADQQWRILVDMLTRRPVEVGRL
jgi:hypothetical protein